MDVKAVAKEITIECGSSFSKDDAKIAINILNAWKFIGIKGVANFIKVESQSKDILVKKLVDDLHLHNWAINSKDVKGDVNRNNIKPSGIVYSIYQKGGI